MLTTRTMGTVVRCDLQASWRGLRFRFFGPLFHDRTGESTVSIFFQPPGKFAILTAAQRF